MYKKIVAFIIATCLPLVFILSGCSFLMSFITGSFNTSYMSPEKYSVGNALIEDGSGLSIIHIMWVSGSVSVTTHKENSIVITETANKETTEKDTLHYYYFDDQEGGILWVQFCESGAQDFGDLKKDVTIVIPEVDGLYCGATLDSADFTIVIDGYENTVDKFSLTNNFGSVNARFDEVTTFQASGCGEEDSKDCVWAVTANRISSFGFNTSYAKMSARINEIATAEHCGSVFNDFELYVQSIRKLTVDIGSRGDQKITALSFNSISVKNRDGNVRLYLSPDAAFEMTVKGQKRASALEIGYEYEEAEGKYTVGQSGKTVRIETESNVYVQPYADNN